MITITKRPLCTLLLAAIAAATSAPACETPEKKAESPYAKAPDPNEPEPHDIVVQKPWTLKFVKSAVLIAQDVRVEGPDGLLEHFVTRQELEITDVDTKTTADGLLQTVRLKSGMTNGDIRAQLDNLAITCMHKLEVLERPGPAPIVVQANGDVFYQETGTETPTRGASLRLEATVDKPGDKGAPAKSEKK